MAKRRENPEGVFTDPQYNAIERAIRTMRDRATRKQPVLTVNDLLALYVDPTHHELCRQAHALLGTDPTKIITTKWPDPLYDDEKVNVVFTLNQGDETGLTFPNYAGEVLYEKGAAYEKVRTWVAWRLERGREWSLVDAVFRTLHRHGGSYGVVHFYLPAITNLMQMTDERKVIEQGAKMAKMGTPRVMPNFPRAFKKACAEANHTIVKGLLLPSEVSEPNRDVKARVALNYHCEKPDWSDGETRLYVQPGAM